MSPAATAAPAPRVLLIHLGQLGDAVMALPAAQALRAAYPAGAVTVLAARGSDEIFAWAGFQQVWAIDRRQWKREPWRAPLGLAALLTRIRREGFQLSVDLHSYKETNLLAWIARIPERVAMLRPTRTWPRLLTRLPPPDDPGVRLLERYCRVLEPLGLTVQERVPRLDPPPGAMAAVAARLAAWDAAGETGPLLGLCPGAGFTGRRWPAAGFAALAAAWADRGARVVVFAGPEEDATLLGAFQGLARTRVWRGLRIPELGAALARCRVVVTNPTGPSHIAAAVGGRVVTLGEIPAFDPVPRPAGAVLAVRADRIVADISQERAMAAVAQLWSQAAG